MAHAIDSQVYMLPEIFWEREGWERAGQCFVLHGCMALVPVLIGKDL